MGRTLIVGDIHGCLQELDDLLESSGFRASDELISVGDLVAKGPDSLGVVRRFRGLDGRAIRGNHDQHCLRWWDAKKAGDPLPDLRWAHQEVVEVLEEEDWHWLEALPLWIELPEHDALVVHAGLLPWLPLEEQEPSDLMNMRSILDDGTASSDYDDGEHWPKHWPGPRLVVFGHDAMRGLQRHEHAIGLDTGCVYGGALSAVWLPEREIISVPARQVYCEPG